MQANYTIAKRRGDPDRVEIGPVLERDWGDIRTTLNPVFTREIGVKAQSGVRIDYAAEVAYKWRPWLTPAIQAYGGLGRLPPRIKIRHEAGYLFGLGRETPPGSVTARLDLETRL